MSTELPNARNIVVPPIPTSIEDKSVREYLNSMSKIVETVYTKAFDNSDAVRTATDNNNTTLSASISALLPAGSIVMHGGTTPSGWLTCDGAAVSRTTYAALFAVIGTTYGAGDASTTFNVPNFTSKMVRGNTPGTGAGSDTHVHAGPSHTHTGPSHTHTVSKGGAYSYNGTGTTLGYIGISSGEDSYYSSRPSTQDFTTSSDGTGATGAEGTGNTGSGSTLPAYTAVSFIIKT